MTPEEAVYNVALKCKPIDFAAHSFALDAVKLYAEQPHLLIYAKERDKLRADLETALKTRGELEEETHRLRADRDGAVAANVKLAGTCDLMSHETRVAWDTVDGLRRELNATKTQKPCDCALRGENAKLKERVARAEKERDVSKRMREYLRKNLNNAGEQLNSAKAELSVMRSNAAHVHEERDQLRTEVNLLENRKAYPAYLQVENAKLKEQVANMELHQKKLVEQRDTAQRVIVEMHCVLHNAPCGMCGKVHYGACRL